MWRGARLAVYVLCVSVGLGGAAFAQKAPKPAPPAKAAPKPAPPAPAKGASPAVIDLAVLRANLQSTDLERATQAARQLGQVQTPDALKILLDSLAMGLHPTLAGSVIDAVALYKDARAMDVLLYYSHHRAADVRGRAIAALGQQGDARVAAAVQTGLRDSDASVRAAAAQVAAARKDAAAISPLMALLVKGDAAVAEPLAKLSTPDTARKLGELIGEAPDALLAQCLGAILVRPDFGPEAAYVEVVRVLGKLPGDDAIVALTTFIGSTPEVPVRQSRREAQALYEQKLGGGQ
jgi:HEAT repeat protein